ncbi:hypothetical protein FEK35_02080 [Nocardia cyriacigeorgica]|uniref:Uncharacterized protein n=1 Tax=Nocardia cyriacigeorgica TaxID=135487 RepID=A0A5R8PLN9_9NOCA|nr:hypothetical protein [Nocardia cyriacigeorgica]TLG17935.1 hypothetical protein FEK35_02080 [Nocardia cyriacigeorgica]
MYYLDLLTNAAALDHGTWAGADVLTSTLDLEAARQKSRKSGNRFGVLGLLMGALCCLLVVAGIIGLIVWLVNRANNDGPPRPPYPPQQYPPHNY